MVAVKKIAGDVNWYCSECHLKLTHEHEPCPTCIQLFKQAGLRAASPDDLRDLGWAVAIHNDYWLNGQGMTFWLLTKASNGRFVKGEGRTDAEALNRCRMQILPDILPSKQDAMEKIIRDSTPPKDAPRAIDDTTHDFDWK